MDAENGAPSRLNPDVARVNDPGLCRCTLIDNSRHIGSHIELIVKFRSYFAEDKMMGMVAGSWSSQAEGDVDYGRFMSVLPMISVKRSFVVCWSVSLM